MSRFLLLTFFLFLTSCTPDGQISNVAPTNPTKSVLTSCPSSTVAGINFDVGYKQQTETDYAAGGLTFSRIYRSDSTWTDNTVGDFWRHIGV